MPNKATKTADLGELLDMVLISASKAGETDFSSSPHYLEYEQHQKTWSDILKTMDKPTVERYKNTVDRAFNEYQDCFRDCFWAWGLINAIEKCIQPHSPLAAYPDKTAVLDRAEKHLDQMCKNFASHLSEDDRRSFSDYFQHRKNSINLTGSYCCKHGMEFMRKLLDRVGFGKTDNADEV